MLKVARFNDFVYHQCPCVLDSVELQCLYNFSWNHCSANAAIFFVSIPFSHQKHQNQTRALPENLATLTRLNLDLCNSFRLMKTYHSVLWNLSKQFSFEYIYIFIQVQCSLTPALEIVELVWWSLTIQLMILRKKQSSDVWRTIRRFVFFLPSKFHRTAVKRLAAENFVRTWTKYSAKFTDENNGVGNVDDKEKNTTKGNVVLSNIKRRKIGTR